jgi:plastocyanin
MSSGAIQPTPPATGRITGHVEISTELSKRRANFRIYGDAAPAAEQTGAASEMANVVIYLETEDGAPLPSAPSPTKTMAQLNERFVPHVLPVTQGSAVSFPNQDDVFHNVFSLSSAMFDLGRYRKGETRTVHFDKPGAVQVFCHIHSDMNAVILVLPNAYFARPDGEGRFSIDDVPPGTYRVVGWHERVKPIVKRITITPGQTASLDFNIPFVRP